MTAFAVTWDYRCPFARNAHEHVLAGLAAGASWEVEFVPFSLGQVHVADGEPDIWERPDDDSGLLALQAAVAVRDAEPDRFPAVHLALFALRHDQGGHLRDEATVRGVLDRHGVDSDAVFERIAAGEVLTTVRKEHEAAVAGHQVWGVPTFVAGDRAVFVRLMDRPGEDGQHARRTVDRVLDLLDAFQALNEFKATTIPR